MLLHSNSLSYNGKDDVMLLRHFLFLHTLLDYFCEISWKNFMQIDKKIEKGLQIKIVPGIYQ